MIFCNYAYNKKCRHADFMSVYFLCAFFDFPISKNQILPVFSKLILRRNTYSVAG